MANKQTSFNIEPISVGILDNDILALRMLRNWIEPDTTHYQLRFATKYPDQAIELCLHGIPHTQALILDMSLNGNITGREVLHDIRKNTDTVGVLCVTAYSIDEYRDIAVKGGAQGLLSKDELSPNRLWQALKLVRHGLPCTPNFDNTIDAHRRIRSSSINDARKLTSTELQVLREYARGASPQEISQKLHMAINTVYQHAHQIVKKWQAKDIHEAVLRYDRDHRTR